MRIALHDSENKKYPNLALMKLSAWHKTQGDDVEFYSELFDYDKIYSSKVFTFTEENKYLPLDTEKGGTGYNIKNNLPDEIEHICPDYSLYGINYSMGFLTRGCSNKCKWCIVPVKEGNIKPNADIEEFARHKEVVLLDNNVLASEHGLKQIEKISKLGLKIDFNQGLDARLIDNSIAKLLSKVKWLKPLRLACDSQSQKKHIQNAVQLLRKHNCTPRRYFVYAIIQDIEESLDRIEFLRSLNLDPFCQPYRDFENNTEPTHIQKRLARYVNHKAIFKSVSFSDYISGFDRYSEII